MHVVFRESRGLEETATPRDIGQNPADLVVLSYSDSDLAAFAAGWRRGRDSLPSLRLANLAELRHPLSVDTYVERTLSQARGILVRLIGGESYWSYGLAALHQLAKDRNIVLAVLPADGRDDTRLDAYSTLPVSTLRRLKVLCDTGGPVAAQAAIAQLALASGLYGIEHKLQPSEPIVGNAYELKPTAKLALPVTLWEAAQRLRKSKAANELFGEEFVEHFAATREWEEREFRKHITDWELARYFEII